MKNIWLLSLIILSWSCNDVVRQQFGIINPMVYTEEKMPLSDFADDIFYIPLDPSIVIGNINKLVVTDSCFFISTIKSELLVFDRSGKFKNKIGKIGNGPGEYRYSNNFAIDRKSRLIYLLDQKRVIVYSFNGDYVRDFSISKYGGDIQDISILDGKIYLFEFISFGQAKYDWLVLNTQGDSVTSKVNSVPLFKTNEGGTGSAFSSGSEIIYQNLYNDTIFGINDSSFHAAYLFAKAPFRLPLNDVGKETAGFNILGMVKTPDRLWLTYFWKDSFFTSFFDSKNQKLIVLNKAVEIDYLGGGPGITNDLDGGMAFVPIYLARTTKSQFLVSWIYTYEIKTHVASESFKNSTPKYPVKKNEYEKLANHLTGNDNPVLRFAKLKN